VLVVFTADRGLSGSFNANIIKNAEQILRAEPETQWQLVCVGRKGRDYFARRQWPIVESLVGLGGTPDLTQARRLAALLLDLYTSDRADSIWLLYSAFVSMVVYRPTLARYLPLSAESLGIKPEPRARTTIMRSIISSILRPMKSSISSCRGSSARASTSRWPK